jgi:protein-disulfide isomerase
LHDWIFVNQTTWSKAQDAPVQFRKQAVVLGVDGAQYDTCLTNPATEARINRDVQDGTRMGVQGTPSVFVNDWYKFRASLQELQQMIAKAQQGIHPPPTPTPLPANVLPYDADPARPGFTYDGSPTLGAANARLVLIAFEDFKCGYCAQHFKTVEPTLKAKYFDTGQMRYVFKFFPVFAPKSAVAALCAGDQGKFWPFHDLLFGKQAEWKEGDDAAMTAYATSLGLDAAKFKQCLKDAPDQALIDADSDLAQQVGVRGTPYFLLLDARTRTGTRIPGALPLDQFEKAIRDLLNPPTPTPGK